MERVNTSMLGGGSNGQVSLARRSPLPVSVAAQKFKRSIVFTEVNKGFFSDNVTTHYRGLDGRILVMKGEVTFESGIISSKLSPGLERVYLQLPTGFQCEVVININQFATAEIAKKSKGSSFKFASAIWEASAISGLFRTAFWIHNPVNPDVGITQGLGYTSAMGVMTGPITVMDSIKNLKKAKKIGDVAGVRLAKMGVAKGVLETGSGAVMGGVRTLNIVSLSTTSKVITVAGSVLGIASSVGFIAIFSIFAVRFARALVTAASLLKNLNAAKQVDEAFGALTKMLCLDYDELIKCSHVTEYKTDNEFKKLVTEKVELTEKEAEILTLSDEEFVNDAISKETDGFENLRVRYLKEIARVKLVKEIEYQRTVGGASLSLIREAQKCGDRTPATMERIVKTAKVDLVKQVAKQALFLFAVFVGAASFVITTIFTAGAPLVIGYVLMLVSNLILAGADMSSLIERIKNLKKSSTKEKVVMVFMMVLTMGAMAAGAFFTGGASLLIVALIIGVMMLTVQGSGIAYACYIDKQNKKKKEEVTHIDHGSSLGYGDINDDDGDIRRILELCHSRKRSERQHTDGIPI